MSHGTALIVGAGIGGLAAGIALRHRGWKIRIFEQAPEPRAVGFALSVAPNAVNALAELGLADRVTMVAWPVSRAELRNADGVALKRFNVEAALGQARSLFVLREVLHRTLLEAAGADDVAFASRITGIEVERGSVRLTLDGGRTASGDVLIGADGVNSSVRRWLHPHDPPVRDSGFVGIRGLARGAAGQMGDLSIVGYMGGGVEAGNVRASEAAVYWFVSTRAGNAPATDARGEALLAYCAQLLDAPFRAIVSSTAIEDVRIDTLVDREAIEPWGHGPVTLLGDASQPVLPHTGQGAALALEDAVALKLALGSGDIVAALRRYERVRAARKRPFITRGRFIARFTTARHPVAAFARETAIRLMPARAAASSFLIAQSTDPHRSLRVAPDDRPTGP